MPPFKVQPGFAIGRFDNFEEVIKLAKTPRRAPRLPLYVERTRRCASDDDTNFGQVYVNKTGPEQLQDFRTGYRLSDQTATTRRTVNEKHLHRETVDLPYEASALRRRSISRSWREAAEHPGEPF